MMPESTPPDDNGPAPYWKCAVAAAPQLLIGLQFLLAHWNIRVFGLGTYDLTAALAVEAIALYAGLMFGLLWLLLSGSPFLRRMRDWQIVVIVAVCAGAAFSLGAADAIQFLVMTVVTYLGLLMSWRHPSALLQAIARWVVAYAALALGVSLFKTPEMITHWGGDAGVLDAGTLYFFIIGSVELSGFYLQYLPRNHELLKTRLYGLLARLRS